jgi:hypothetical protein
MRFTNRRSALGAAFSAVTVLAMAVATWLTVVSPSFGAAGERHVVKIFPNGNIPTPSAWSVWGDLYDGTGNHIGKKPSPWSTWSESHPGGTDYVRWEYTDGGDGGWIDLHITPSEYAEGRDFTKLKLGENHCYKITDEYTVEEEGNCPFK